MEIKNKKQVIVLKSSDYKENASLVTVLTNESIESFIVRGTKKQNSKTKGLINKYNVIDIVHTTNKVINTITEGYIINSNVEISSDLVKLNYLDVISHKILTLSSSITNFNILYNFIIDILDLIKKTKYPEMVILLFEIKLLYLLGVAPTFKKCLKCQTEVVNALFDLQSGRVICENCSLKYHHNKFLNIHATHSFKQIYLTKIKDVNEEFLKNHYDNYNILNDFIDEYYLEYLGYKSNTKKIIKSILI